jgi:hypothetical protein
MAELRFGQRQGQPNALCAVGVRFLGLRWRYYENAALWLGLGTAWEGLGSLQPSRDRRASLYDDTPSWPSIVALHGPRQPNAPIQQAMAFPISSGESS